MQGTATSVPQVAELLGHILLGYRVDLVTEDGLKARLRERVLRDAVPL
jgi:predicted nucleotidyltransferase